MPNTWPKERRLIGTKVPRLDAAAKATGTAKYGYDVNRPGMLHARILRCPLAHAKLKSLDTAAAEKTPGFKALHLIKAKAGDEYFYAGDEILAIAADTEEHVRDCLQAVKIEFDPLPFLVQEADVLEAKPGPGTVPNSQDGNARQAGTRTVGNVDDAFAKADAVAESVSGVAVQTHCCLETHGLVAEWDGDNLTVWASTQAVPGVAGELTGYFKGKGVPNAKAQCITHYMGGGYGSKFTAGVEGVVACELARKAKAPVKLFLDREEEQITAGNRPSGTARIKIAGMKDGTITAFQGDFHGTPGGGGGAAGVDPYHALCPYVYTAIPNVKTSNKTLRLNAGDRRALRAPGHPQACFMTESAVDDLANKLGLDPMQVRLKNLPPNDPRANDKTSYNALRQSIYAKEIEMIAGLSDWAKKWHPPGKGPNKGPVKHGIGMALHTWGGAGRGNNDVTTTISADGAVLVRCSTQDLGTGERTVLAIVTAEVLGLQPTDVTVQVGESPFGRSTGSGGSTTCPGTAPAALNAAMAARAELFDKLAKKLGAEKADDLAIKPGKIVAKDKEFGWKEACARLGMDTVQAKGDWTPGLSNNGVGGVQVAEVWVDTETGVVRCTKFYAVQDCGLIVNLQGCISQVAGGVIMGLHYCLFEDRILDRHTGRQVNPDMEFYKLAGIQDIPEIVVQMYDMPERGVIGIGEPPTISTAAAVGNAICNAIGVRVPFTPFSPDKVLAALAGGK